MSFSSLIVCRLVVSGLVALLCGACVFGSGRDASDVSSNEVLRIRARTEVPAQAASAATPLSPATSVIIPPSLVVTAWVVRPRAEIREGPGTEFPLRAEVITRGEEVVLFGRVAVWQQVVAIGSGVRGWVHYQTLGRASANHAEIKLRSSLLPRVFAVRAIDSAYSWPEMKALPVAAPQGSMFVFLREQAGRRLVWLPENNSILWVDRKALD